MRIPKNWRVTLWLGMAAITAGCAGPSVAPPVVTGATDARIIHFILRRDLPLARATVNGKDVGFFLIDTGSSISVVDQRAADKLNLSSTETMTVTGIGGTVRVPRCRLDDLTVDRRSFGARPAAIIDMSKFNQIVGWPVAGILGFDCLADGMFTIDYRAGELRLEDRATFRPPNGASMHRLDLIANLPAVQGRLDAKHDAWLQIDTGSNGSLAIALGSVQQRLELLAGKVNTQSDAAGVGGLAGQVNSKLDRLAVFGQELRDVPFQVELAGPQPVTGSDAPLVGRMGNQVHKRFSLTLDLPNHRLWAARSEPRP
jgi:hypothetical protein